MSRTICAHDLWCGFKSNFVKVSVGFPSDFCMCLLLLRWIAAVLAYWSHQNEWLNDWFWLCYITWIDRTEMWWFLRLLFDTTRFFFFFFIINGLVQQQFSYLKLRYALLHCSVCMLSFQFTIWMLWCCRHWRLINTGGGVAFSKLNSFQFTVFTLFIYILLVWFYWFTFNIKKRWRERR